MDGAGSDWRGAYDHEDRVVATLASGVPARLSRSPVIPSAGPEQLQALRLQLAHHLRGPRLLVLDAQPPAGAILPDAEYLLVGHQPVKPSVLAGLDTAAVWHGHPRNLASVRRHAYGWIECWNPSELLSPYWVESLFDLVHDDGVLVMPTATGGAHLPLLGRCVWSGAWTGWTPRRSPRGRFFSTN